MLALVVVVAHEGGMEGGRDGGTEGREPRRWTATIRGGRRTRRRKRHFLL